MSVLFSGLFGTILGVFLTSLFSIPYNRKTLYISSVTNFRAEWAKEIKTFIADFLSYIQCYHEDYKQSDKSELKRKLIQRMDLIELNLNPLKDEWDNVYIEEMKSIYKSVVEDKRIISEDELNKFKNLSQKLVKIEWDGIKLEAKHGTLNKNQKNNLRKKWLR